MTEITSAELKVLGIQVILMALIGFFMFLFSASGVSISSPISNANNQAQSVSSESQSWIPNILSIPSEMGELTFIALLVVSPFIFFDAIIAIRFAKDIATKWI